MTKKKSGSTSVYEPRENDLRVNTQVLAMVVYNCSFLRSFEQLISPYTNVIIS